MVLCFSNDNVGPGGFCFFNFLPVTDVSAFIKYNGMHCWGSESSSALLKVPEIGNGSGIGRNWDLEVLCSCSHVLAFFIFFVFIAGPSDGFVQTSLLTLGVREMLGAAPTDFKGAVLPTEPYTAGSCPRSTEWKTVQQSQPHETPGILVLSLRYGIRRARESR